MTIVEAQGFARLKTCPRCQEAFACQPGRCRCTKLWVPAAVLEALAREYTDCLCAGCLTQIAADAAAPIPIAGSIGK